LFPYVSQVADLVEWSQHLDFSANNPFQFIVTLLVLNCLQVDELLEWSQHLDFSANNHFQFIVTLLVLNCLQVDELLEWSQHLDFSAYLDDWTSLACTLGTEAWVPEVEGTLLREIQPPPPSLDVKGAMVAAGVPLAPFKGGVGPAAGATSGLHVVG
jgi:hypothetical protein